MAQSQYAQPLDMQTFAITAAAAARFGGSAVSGSIQAASSIADSYIVSQFELPLSVDPQGWDASLTLAVCNIAAYLLYAQFGFNPNAPADQLIEERYKRAIAWLEQVRDKLIFPQWKDSSGDETPQLEQGPYVDSDRPVGFTSRGLVNGAGPCGAGDPWWFW